MSASDVQTEILGPMQRIFYPPRKMEPEDEQAALRDYVSALQDFPAADLSASWAFVRDSHPKTSWPIPSAFVLAAARSRRDRQASAGIGKRSQESSQNERWDRWKAISRAPIAYEAVKRGVAWSLKCAVLHDGKRAEEIDLRALVIGKHSAERTVQAMERGEPVEFKGRWVQFTPENSGAALRMWAVLQERETETQAEIGRAA